MVEDFEEAWGDFGIHLGPVGFGFFGPRRYVRYGRTEKSHLLRVRIGPEVKKEDIKVRLLKPGVLEIEWPRRTEVEEIPVE